jgi:hypothetical protein
MLIFANLYVLKIKPSVQSYKIINLSNICAWAGLKMLYFLTFNGKAKSEEKNNQYVSYLDTYMEI